MNTVRSINLWVLAGPSGFETLIGWSKSEVCVQWDEAPRSAKATSGLLDTQSWCNAIRGSGCMGCLYRHLMTILKHVYHTLGEESISVAARA